LNELLESLQLTSSSTCSADGVIHDAKFRPTALDNLMHELYVCQDSSSNVGHGPFIFMLQKILYLTDTTDVFGRSHRQMSHIRAVVSFLWPHHAYVITLQSTL